MRPSLKTISDQTRVELPTALDGERLDRSIATLVGLSRKEAVDLIRAGAVSLDSEVPLKPSLRVRAGSFLEIRLPVRSEQLVADSKVDFEVIYEDAEVIVVDKPPHLVVHPGAGINSSTLVHGLLHRYPELLTVGDPMRPGIVHRLDKGTSGLLMVARTPATYHYLVAQLAERKVSRGYDALVRGKIEADSGVIDAPLGRSARNPVRRDVVASGRSARTHYKVLERLNLNGNYYSRLSCHLETGRTHQIRVHLSAIGHPLAGDPLYGGVVAELGLARPFLHASSLEFEHPSIASSKRFVSPLAIDLDHVLSLAKSALE